MDIIQIMKYAIIVILIALHVLTQITNALAAIMIYIYMIINV